MMIRRKIPVFLLLALLLLPVHAHQLTPAAADVLRLHILANSDSETDQAVKLRVRDALRPLFAAQEKYSDARTFLLQNGAVLQKTAERVLAENNMDYTVQLSLGQEAFPERTYADKTFPAGTYDALIVRLGKGAGHNWWCVLFPPLCIVTEDGAPVDLETVEPESALWNLLKNAEPESAVWKLWNTAEPESGLWNLWKEWSAKWNAGKEG